MHLLQSIFHLWYIPGTFWHRWLLSYTWPVSHAFPSVSWAQWSHPLHLILWTRTTQTPLPGVLPCVMYVRAKKLYWSTSQRRRLVCAFDTLIEANDFPDQKGGSSCLFSWGETKDVSVEVKTINKKMFAYCGQRAVPLLDTAYKKMKMAFGGWWEEAFNTFFVTSASILMHSFTKLNSWLEVISVTTGLIQHVELADKKNKEADKEITRFESLLALQDSYLGKQIQLSTCWLQDLPFQMILNSVLNPEKYSVGADHCLRFILWVWDWRSLSCCQFWLHTELTVGHHRACSLLFLGDTCCCVLSPGPALPEQWEQIHMQKYLEGKLSEIMTYQYCNVCNYFCFVKLYCI